MKKLIMISIILIATVSCTNNVFKQWDGKSFPDYIWESDREIVFEPLIDDIDRTYTITVGLRHIYGLDIPEISIGMSIVAPSESVTDKTFIIRLKDDKGQPAAECSGHLCDIETDVETSFRFSEKGKYSIKFRQLTPYKRLNGIMELGLIIR